MANVNSAATPPKNAGALNKYTSKYAASAFSGAQRANYIIPPLTVNDVIMFNEKLRFFFLGFVRLKGEIFELWNEFFGVFTIFGAVGENLMVKENPI